MKMCFPLKDWNVNTQKGDALLGDPHKNDLTLPETNMAPENGWLEY